MAVGLDDDRWGGHSPPRLGSGSPEVPPHRPRPRRNDVLFVDSNVIYGSDCRLPLLLLAGAGLLEVNWSPFVAAEVARVATREQAIATAAHESTALRDELERRRHEIDRVIADHERYWHSPSPTDLRATYATLPPNVVRDPKDVPVLAGALATRSSFLLTANTKDFPHAQSYQYVVFWHPDTFLTAYFEDDSESYVFVCEEMPLALEKLGAELQP